MGSKNYLQKSMTITEQRDAVQFLTTCGISVRRACTLVRLARATFQYQARPCPEDAPLVADMAALAQANPRYGYLRIWALLRRTRPINRKRQRTRRAHAASVVATHPNHVWAYDFVEDCDTWGRSLRILTVMDEYTREGLDIDVVTSASAEWVISRLAQLVAQYGGPGHLRCVNGPEFVAVAVQQWLHTHQVATLYIDPGCPWQNGKEERFNGTVRDERLNMHVFTSVVEARVRLQAFRRHYTEERPHSALDYLTPSQFKHAWVTA
jgi:putative transposase